MEVKSRDEHGADIVVVIANNHVENCGAPPRMDSRDYQYISTFQNCYGEQWVFFGSNGDYAVVGGDAGWDAVYPVKNGVAEGLVVHEAEAAFIMASWKAATHFWKPT